MTLALQEFRRPLEDDTVEETASRLSYAAKGKWRADIARQDEVDSEDEYLGAVDSKGSPSAKTAEFPRGIRKEHGTSAQSSKRQAHIEVSIQAPRKLAPLPNGYHKAASGSFAASQVRPISNARTQAMGKPSHSLHDVASAMDALAPLGRESPPIAVQCVLDRIPPVPPPLPDEEPLAWYNIYAPEVAWAKLDSKENSDLKQEIDYVSEGSQGRTSGSKLTSTSLGAFTRTPAKNRIKLAPASIISRSRSRRGTHVAGDESEASDKEKWPVARSRSRVVKPQSAASSSETSADVSSESSSESDTDREETDGTDTEVEELLEFKRATRPFSTIKYDERSSSAETRIAVQRRKRRPYLEETIPDTFGAKHVSHMSHILLESAKPGLGPRAVARKSFAKAIGSRLLAKRKS